MFGFISKLIGNGYVKGSFTVPVGGGGPVQTITDARCGAASRVFVSTSTNAFPDPPVATPGSGVAAGTFKITCLAPIVAGTVINYVIFN